eukprot:m.778831 g.778831  ORF g.778831 m.778831 type:complete len:397 (+) comp23273_c0_seq11:557-1747(+)
MPGIACKLFASMPTKNITNLDFVSGAAPPAAPPPPPSTVRLHIQGHQLFDHTGSAVRLTGFNWPLEHVHPGDGKLMLRKLRGANVARIIGVLWDNSDSPTDCYTDTAPYFKETCYGPLDAAVKAATEAGVWVVLTARCAFAAGQAYASDPMANVFHNSTLRNMLYVAWEHVAAHYASWDYIAAYEVLAEPRDKNVNASVVKEFYKGACAVVQSADPNTPCMVGPAPYYKIWHFTSDILLPENPNVIYTFDYFIPPDWCFGASTMPTYPGTYTCAEMVGGEPWTDLLCPHGSAATVNFTAEWNAQNFARFAAPILKTAPVFVNQWSVVHGVPASNGRYTFMSDVARSLQHMGIGWAWWVWRGGGDGWAHGSSEFVYQWTNGTIEYDDAAFAAVAPYV